MAQPSFQDFFNIAKGEAAARQPALTFDEGDISEFYAVAAAAMADHVVGYSAMQFRRLYLDGAKGDDLTTLADDRYAITRFPAEAAAGVVTFTRPNAGGGAGTIAAGTIVATTKTSQGIEVQFATRADLVFTTELTMDATCDAVLTGTGGNVDVAKINRIVTTLFDQSFTVSNAARFAGGADAESDDDLRERVRNFPTTIRRATLAALEYGALQVAGVGRATATEDMTGLVTVYCSDASGNSNPTMVGNVATELENWRAAGSALTVVGGALYNSPTGLVITIAVTARAGTDTQALAANIKAAIVARLNKLKINETCYRSIIRQAVLNVDQNILDCNVIVPATDVAPPSGQIIHTTTGAITIS